MLLRPTSRFADFRYFLQSKVSPFAALAAPYTSKPEQRNPPPTTASGEPPAAPRGRGQRISFLYEPRAPFPPLSSKAFEAKSQPPGSGKGGDDGAASDAATGSEQPLSGAAPSGRLSARQARPVASAQHPWLRGSPFWVQKQHEKQEMEARARQAAEGDDDSSASLAGEEHNNDYDGEEGNGDDDEYSGHIIGRRDRRLRLLSPRPSGDSEKLLWTDAQSYSSFYQLEGTFLDCGDEDEEDEGGPAHLQEDAGRVENAADNGVFVAADGDDNDLDEGNQREDFGKDGEEAAAAEEEEEEENDDDDSDEDQEEARLITYEELMNELAAAEGSQYEFPDFEALAKLQNEEDGATEESEKADSDAPRRPKTREGEEDAGDVTKYFATAAIALTTMERGRDILFHTALDKRRRLRAKQQEKFAELRSARIEARNEKRRIRAEQRARLIAEGKIPDVDPKSQNHRGDLVVPEVVSSIPRLYPNHPHQAQLTELARAIAFNPRLSRPIAFEMVERAARLLSRYDQAPALMPQHHVWMARKKELERQEGRNY